MLDQVYTIFVTMTLKSFQFSGFAGEIFNSLKNLQLKYATRLIGQIQILRRKIITDLRKATSYI